MKRILSILFPLVLVVCIVMLSACKKYSENPSHVATISFPILTLNGAQDTTINRGASWADPGATWKDTITGETGTLKVSVNTSVDSAYILVYTATNKNGFQSTVTRGLGVTNYNGPKDLSGAYTDNAGGADTIVKVSRALFQLPTVDFIGDAGVVVIKSDSTISVATVYTLATGTVGAPLPVTFSQATVNYTSPITFGYNVNVLNVPASAIPNPSPVFTHN